MKERVLASIKAFACGDALGMPTEFMTRLQIRERFGTVKGLLRAEESQNHSDLPSGSVTDDTEQNLYLLRIYRKDHTINVDNTAAALLSWIRETDAVAKRYIGPSSKSALEAVEQGADPHTTGTKGTTCGGIMRVPSVVWFDPMAEEDVLAERVVHCLMPTHYTFEALEAAGAYAFALQKALQGGSREQIIEAAIRGAVLCKAKAPYESCAPSPMSRIKLLYPHLPSMEEEQLLTVLFDVFGTGLPSVDVCTAAFLIWLKAENSSWKAISLGASVGGDTDTISALAGALTAAENGTIDIPKDIISKVSEVNRLNFETLL